MAHKFFFAWNKVLDSRIKMGFFCFWVVVFVFLVAVKRHSIVINFNEGEQDTAILHKSNAMFSSDDSTKYGIEKGLEQSTVNMKQAETNGVCVMVFKSKLTPFVKTTVKI